jgi:UDPglucose 6-dehydrogenase
MYISWIGLGKLGLPCAEIIASKDIRVNGYDIERKKTKRVLQFPNIAGAVSSTDIVFVSVPTPHDPAYDGSAPTSHLPPKDFDYTILEDVVTECDRNMRKGQILVIISTVLPGTIERIKKKITKATLIYNPYLIAMGTVAWDMVNPEMVMIGTEDGKKSNAAKTLIDFYKIIMENDPRYVVGTYNECECIKVFYNTFISTKIALVNMIQDVAVKQGNINVDVVTDALAHSSQRITGPAYMKAGMGDGGACHPRDNIALRYLADKLNLGYDIFDSIMTAREQQACNMAKEILKKGNAIQFSSNSYKAGVEYTDGSYSLLVQHYVKELGGKIVEQDPDVYVKVHATDDVPENVEIFDPWKGYGNG